MYLKSLEMAGFKSFVDATKLEFPRGFTAIVGPNGCGKSNISDAIRWVIGEQSSKTLRGTKMEDLIFNGSESRKAHGMAEVSMTIANLPKITPDGGLPLAEEAKVTRRFYRSGESEYFINKTPCRLRDIIDLFLDTGISSRAFSIIEQGHINQLINSKPVDRRFIIEEAAGIMKYKYRRNEALRKMEAAQANLVRVNDSLNELRRQLGSLKRQASKAEAYKKKKTELRETSLSVHASDYRQHKNAFDEISAVLEKSREERDSRETELATLNNQLETLKTDIAFREKEVNKLKENGFEIEGAINGREARTELMKKQIEGLINDRSRAMEEISQMEEDLRRTGHTQSVREAELSKAVTDISVLEETFEEKNEILREAKSQLDQARYDAEELDSGILNLNQIFARQDSNRVSLQTRLGILVQREERIHADEQELSRHMDEAREKEKRAVEQLESISRELEKQKEQLKGLLARLEENNSGLKTAQSELDEKKNAKSRLAGKLSSLEEFQKNFEGIQGGARVLLKRRETEGLPEGIRCVLADVMETAPEYELAVEAALGERLQGLIVENGQAGKEAIDYLKAQAAGRSAFVPLLPRRTGSPVRFPETREGIFGKAVDLVKTKPEYREMLDILLEDALIVKDMESALALWGRNGANCSFVTLEGDIISPEGTITGGSPARTDSGLLSKKRLINELRQEDSALALEMEAIQGRIAGKRASITELEREKSEVDQKILFSERQRIHDEKDLHQIREAMEKDIKKLEAHRLEINAIREEREKSREEAEGAERELLALKEQKEAMEKEIASSRKILANLQESVDIAKEEANEFNIQLVSLKHQKENIALDIERLKAGHSAIEERIEKRKQWRHEAENKKTQMEKDMEDIGKEVLELLERRRIIKSSIVEKEEAMRELADQCAAWEARAKEKFQEVEEMKGRIQEGDLKKAELNLRLDNIIQRLRDDFDIGLEALLAEYPAEINKEEFAQKAADLKEQLARFNDVNLGALEEYNVVNERHGFMEGQYNDLISSINDLNTAIEKINKTTSHRFLETFQQVNENFKMNFRRLFAGGRAEMVLTEPENILETGIDVIVQPPGKKLQNIIMLSAGEKAMTALSVLFSVFMTKPSPFCLLDEVDAPLDEANIHRFKEILRELSDKTQFLIITHNQKTMTFAETLYGVTMEEKGVSKVVSVNLERPKEQESLQAETKTEQPLDENYSAVDEEGEKEMELAFGVMSHAP